MSLLHVEGVTHWSIPVNNLEESEDFYGDLLGLTPVGRLGTARIACFTVGEHHILLCERAATMDHTFVEDPKVHHGPCRKTGFEDAGLTYRGINSMAPRIVW